VRDNNKDYTKALLNAEQILRFAKNNKMDLIVMGSRRLKGVLKIKALGSVTRKVSEIADCPVLIVH
jgi:nucleotide-binding universal stress UspA family protein